MNEWNNYSHHFRGRRSATWCGVKLMWLCDNASLRPYCLDTSCNQDLGWFTRWGELGYIFASLCFSFLAFHRFWLEGFMEGVNLQEVQLTDWCIGILREKEISSSNYMKRAWIGTDHKCQRMQLSEWLGPRPGKMKREIWKWENFCCGLYTVLDSLLLEKHIFKLRMEIFVKIQTDY